MSESGQQTDMPEAVAAMARSGYARWATGAEVDPQLRGRFDPDRIPVVGIRHVRLWGLQVDDEREMFGHERTQVPDEEIWNINLVSRDGSHYEVDSSMLTAA